MVSFVQVSLDSMLGKYLAVPAQCELQMVRTNSNRYLPFFIATPPKAARPRYILHANHFTFKLNNRKKYHGKKAQFLKFNDKTIEQAKYPTR